MSFTVEVLPSEAWSEVVAGRWLEFTAANPAMRLSLPTGATPRPLYREVADRGIDLTGAEVFLLDEFAGLPADSPGRCDTMLHTDLLRRLSRPPAIVHTFDMAATDLPEMCARYEAAIDDSGLDLSLLGLGANGHIGLNEPGSAASTRTRVVELHPTTAAAARALGASRPGPTRGVTMGVGTLLEAATIWLLVTGAHKAAILAQAVAGPIGPGVPASFLREHADTIVFADEAAAAQL